MSLFSALSVSLSGLQATSTQLQITANNVSNASQEGFTRKSAILATASLGDIGGGTKVMGFTRATDKALFTTLSTATSNAGLRGAQDDYLTQVQDLLGTSSSDDPSLSQLITSFTSSWNALAAEPESSVNQRQVVQNANNMCEEIQRVAEAVEDLDRQCYEDVNSTLSDLNNYLVQIRDLNQKISQAYNAGQSTGDLEDQRDKLTLKVSELTGVTVLQRNYGQVAIYTSTGYQLVDGDVAREFSYDGTDISSSANPGLSLNTALSGGKIEALVNFRATTSPVSVDPSTSIIQKLRGQLDTIATAFTTTITTATSGQVTFAQAYNSATTAAGELANGFFTGTDRTNIAVNAALLNGTSRVKVACAEGVSDAMLDATRSFSAAGLNATATSYSTLVTSVLTGFQQSASNVSALKETAANQQSYLQQRLTNETNVNVDTEMVALITLQQTYSATARTMTVVRDLFNVLTTLIS